MKLKRLIAITVVLAIVLSCSCVAGITASAADGDETVIYRHSGILKTADGKNDATLGTLYGRTADGYTIGGVVSSDSSAYVNGVGKFALGQSYKGTGSIASYEYAADSGRTGNYYGVSYYTLRYNSGWGTFPLISGEANSLADNVLSLKIDICIPEASKTVARSYYPKLAKGTLDSTVCGLKVDYAYNADAEKGYLSVPSYYSDTFTGTEWSNTVEVETGKWYSCEIRYTFDAETETFIGGGYIEGNQVSYYDMPFSDTQWKKSNADATVASVGSIAFGQCDIITGTNSTTDPESDMTYYDEIILSVIEGKTVAPRAIMPYEDEYLWAHFDIDEAPETGLPLGTTDASVYSEEIAVSGSSCPVGATYTVENDAVYGGKVLKQSVAVSELAEDNYHRIVDAFRNFYTRHNGIDSEVVTEYAVDIKIPAEDIAPMRSLKFEYNAGDSSSTNIKAAYVYIENGRISAWDSAGTEGYVADVADTQISKSVDFTPDVWHKVRVLNYYNYDAVNKCYNVKVQALCDNYIIFENQFVLTQPEGYEKNFGMNMIDFRTFSSAENTIETYFGDITIKSFANGAYDDSAFDWYKDPNRVEYSAVREDTKVTVTANIYGNEGVTGDACMVVAVFGADGKVIKLVPTTVTLPEAVDGYRTISAELTNDGVVAGNKVRAFLFDSMLSAKPLIPSYVGTLE